MQFQWDSTKAEANRLKHGVSIREAATALRDALSTHFRTRRTPSSMAGGVRGKYVERLKAGANVALLDDDVAAAYPSDAAVNEALRATLKTTSDGK